MSVPSTPRWPLAVLGAGACLAALAGGGACSRESYRLDADRDAYAIVGGVTVGTPWEVPAGFSIDPPPDSRLHDPGDPDRPALPHPGPHLYSYELPPGFEEPRREPAAEAAVAAGDGRDVQAAGLPVQPIPAAYWDALPPGCLARMLEFASVRGEHRREYETAVPAELRDPSPRLTLAAIVELALLNSREYQARKETLYTAALAVSLERFDYTPKFSPSGNGTDADWIHDRRNGETVTSAGFASGLGFDTLLATGGSLLARFANSVVLTFDGPEGFSKDISSEMLFSFSQSLLQRDLRLNSLVQAERSLVYAARDFARFRRTFFVQLAAQYYGLLQNYRNIEIESQNYFSLVRTFEQAQSELRAGVRNAPNPVAVDQFEQSMLSGRSSLISTSNQLEQGLDSLKLTMGIPTETPLNLDTSELDTLTLQDQIEVAAERVQRWLNRVEYRRRQEQPDRAEILNADIFLIERLLEWLRLRQNLEPDVPDTWELDLLLSELRVDQARVEELRAREELQLSLDAGARAPQILVYQRTDDLIESLIALARRQLELANARRIEDARIETARAPEETAAAELERLRERIPQILQDPQQAGLEELLVDAGNLEAMVAAAVQQLDELPGIVATDAQDPTERTLEQTDRLVALAESLLVAADTGLTPVNLEVDDAMATALVQRFDLMNERGRLADDRRAIKITADELRSILNFDASHSLRTRDNKPFRFSSEESQSRLAVSVDLPLNRRAQRNDYRRALINYQAGRRSLTELEDAIKFDIRDGLRQLEETRIQYPISVTQAALAAEQVISVRLQLALGVEGVRGTDLLDALQSSREALIAVANNRIGYIVDRARFILDLEVMRLDDAGFWGQVDDPDFQPAADLVYPENAGPTYGRIPDGLLLSEEIRETEDSPLPGVAPATAAEAGRVSAGPTPAGPHPEATPAGAAAAVSAAAAQP